MIFCASEVSLFDVVVHYKQVLLEQITQQKEALHAIIAIYAYLVVANMICTECAAVKFDRLFNCSRAGNTAKEKVIRKASHPGCNNIMVALNRVSIFDD